MLIAFKPVRIIGCILNALDNATVLLEGLITILQYFSMVKFKIHQTKMCTFRTTQGHHIPVTI